MYGVSDACGGKHSSHHYILMRVGLGDAAALVRVVVAVRVILATVVVRTAFLIERFFYAFSTAGRDEGFV